jgi:hypothetical protein
MILTVLAYIVCRQPPEVFDSLRYCLAEKADHDPSNGFVPNRNVKINLANAGSSTSSMAHCKRACRVEYTFSVIFGLRAACAAHRSDSSGKMNNRQCIFTVRLVCNQVCQLSQKAP